MLSRRQVISSPIGLLIGNNKSSPFSVSSPTGAFPVKLSADKTYVVDENNKPVFITGDVPANLITTLSREDAEIYLADRGTRGFNVLWMEAADNVYQPNPPYNFYGKAPFSGADFTNFNEAYWIHVDYILDRALAYGATVLLNPGFVGWTSSEGYLNSYMGSSDAVLAGYGAFLGSRYKRQRNIIWLLGGDADPHYATLYAKLDVLATALKAADPNHLITFEAIRGKSSRDVWRGLPSWLDLNWVFEAIRGKSSRDVWRGLPSWLDMNWIYETADNAISGAQRNYVKYGRAVSFMGEDFYEGEHAMTSLGLRQEGYGGVLGGAYVGRIFGNSSIWTFNSPNGAVASASLRRYGRLPPWKGQLGSAGSVSQALLGQLFRSRAHWLLVPDTANAVMTTGAFHGSVCARTSGGQTIIVYVPTSQTVTIDMSNVTDANASAKASWFNPRTGAVTGIGSFATSGSRNFVSPDACDWVLVIDAASSNLAAPGTRDL